MLYALIIKKIRDTLAVFLRLLTLLLVYSGRATAVEVSTLKPHDTRPNGPTLYPNRRCLNKDPKSNLVLPLRALLPNQNNFVFLSEMRYAAELRLALLVFI